MRRRNSSTSVCCGAAAITCIKCNPCSIPNNNLSCSINGGAASTLVVSGSSWTDGTNTLSCTAGYLEFTDGFTFWTLTSSTCNFFDVHFFDGGSNTAVITSSSGTLCADCTSPCNTCNLPVVGTFKIVDALGTWTAKWNGVAWSTPQLFSASVTPVNSCVGSLQTCGAVTTTASTWYVYVVESHWCRANVIFSWMVGMSFTFS